MAGRSGWRSRSSSSLAACFAASAVAAKHTAPRTRARRRSPRGLDYFHARQKSDGGFGTMAATAWVILGAVASGERIGSTMWTVDGNNPFGYLQAHSHEAAATGPDVDNAPVYYARAIMSYVAADRAERVFVAGTPRIDLLAKLYSYQDLVDGSPTKGSFSPSTSSRKFQAVHTTAWAILAMQALGDDEKDRFALAEQWLATQQLADGGFPAQVRRALQLRGYGGGDPGARARRETCAVDPAIIPAARQYLKANQRVDGGFPYKPPARGHRRLGHRGRHPGHPRHGREARRRRLDGRHEHAQVRARHAPAHRTAPTTRSAATPPGRCPPPAGRWSPCATSRSRRSPRPGLRLSRPSCSARRSKSVLAEGRPEVHEHPLGAHPRHVHRRRQGHRREPSRVPRLRRRPATRRSRPTSGATRLQPAAQERRQRPPHVQARDRRSRRQRQEGRAPLHDRRPDADAHADAHLRADPGPPVHTAPASSYPTPTPTSTPTPYTTLTPTAYPSSDTTVTPTPYQSGGYPVTGAPVASPSPSGSPGAGDRRRLG